MDRVHADVSTQLCWCLLRKGGRSGVLPPVFDAWLFSPGYWHLHDSLLYTILAALPFARCLQRAWTWAPVCSDCVDSSDLFQEETSLCRLSGDLRCCHGRNGVSSYSLHLDDEIWVQMDGSHHGIRCHLQRDHNCEPGETSHPSTKGSVAVRCKCFQGSAIFILCSRLLLDSLGHLFCLLLCTLCLPRPLFSQACRGANRLGRHIRAYGS
jgi:hypothetical protein